MKPSTFGGLYKGLAYFVLFIAAALIYDALVHESPSMGYAVACIGAALGLYTLGRVLDHLADIRAALRASAAATEKSQASGPSAAKISRGAQCEDDDSAPIYRL